MGDSSDHPSSEHEPMFCMEPAVYVRIDYKHGRNLALDFMRWCMDNEILGFRGSSSGPTGYTGFFYPEDADKIRAWLQERQLVEYDWKTGHEIDA